MNVSAEFVTSAADAGGFPRERLPELAIVGNLKFDLSVPVGVRERGIAFRVAAGGARPVWIAASTHEGEELPVLKAHAEVLRRFPDALLLVAPRHPERFKPLASACRAFGVRTAVRSEEGGADPSCQCFVVDSMGELIEFYAAVARKDLKGRSGEGWHPEQAVSREQALKMFTIWPAYAAFEERDRGTIEVGKLADLTVLSADIMTMPASTLSRWRPLSSAKGMN